MINRTYDKASNATQLLSELRAAGLNMVVYIPREGDPPFDPAARRQFYGVTQEPQVNPTQTIVHCVDDLTPEEEAQIDAVVDAHVPQGG